METLVLPVQQHHALLNRSPSVKTKGHIEGILASAKRANTNNVAVLQQKTAKTHLKKIPLASISIAASSATISNSSNSSSAVPVVRQATPLKRNAGIMMTTITLAASGSIPSTPVTTSTSSVATPGGTTTTTGSTSSSATTNGHQIPSDILDDLACRFIINVPYDYRNNLIRICFQIELAHWFYLDFFCAIEEKKLVPCGIKQFALHLFEHIPFLRPNLSTIDKILEDWKQYKLSVPTFGAILLSEDLKYVLLVQSYWAKSSWGFPKGKVNEHEDPVHCATREVYEETGYDITKLIIPNEYIDAVINYQYTRLYIVRNVPLQTQFTPQTRKEIKCCEWFPVDLLPTNKGDQLTKSTLGFNANSFFMIMPFIKRLKKWVQDSRSGTDRSMQSADENLNGGKYSDGDRENAATTTRVSRRKFYDTSTGATSSQKRQRHKSMGDLDCAGNNSTSAVEQNNNRQPSSSNTSYTLNRTQSTSSPFKNNQQTSVAKVLQRSATQQMQAHATSKSNPRRQLFTVTATSTPVAGAAAASQIFQFASSTPLSSSILNSSAQNTPVTDKKSELDSAQQQTTLEGCTKSQQQKMRANLSHMQKLSSSRNQKQQNKSKENFNRQQQLKQPEQKARNNEKYLLVEQENNSKVTNQQLGNLNGGPSFDSWTKFRFTRNFITNVFC